MGANQPYPGSVVLVPIGLGRSQFFSQSRVGARSEGLVTESLVDLREDFFRGNEKYPVLDGRLVLALPELGRHGIKDMGAHWGNKKGKQNLNGKSGLAESRLKS